jgi:hypothetical protein
MDDVTTLHADARDDADRSLDDADATPADDPIAAMAYSDEYDEEAVRAATYPRAPGAQPDPDVECIVALSLPQPVTAAMLSAGLHARIGKTVRWFGRTTGSGAWHIVTDASTERFSELAACLLLADRNGAASEAQVQSFLRVAGELGAGLGARVATPDAKVEVQRAEALDRLCADLDVQIGLTVMKPEPGTVARVVVVPGAPVEAGAELVVLHDDLEEAVLARMEQHFEGALVEFLRDPTDPGARTEVARVRSGRIRR